MRRRNGRAGSTPPDPVRPLEPYLRVMILAGSTLGTAVGNPKKRERFADGFFDVEKRAGRGPAYALASGFGVN